MQLPFTDLFTNILGVQSLAQFGAKQSEPLNEVSYEDLICDAFLQNLPTTLSQESASVVYIKDNLAVMPDTWGGGGVGSSWLNVQSSQRKDVGCMHQFKHTANFIAFDDAFFGFLGNKPSFEIAHSFPAGEDKRVHEAPVFVPEMNELVFADTSVVGWLYALDVVNHNIRQIETLPPLPNVNGGTRHGDWMYLTTNGSPTPGIWNCSLPTLMNVRIPEEPERVRCTPVVNNYRLAHLNAPNDLIFTSQGHILFTDPNYGWFQEWPGVGPPVLPTTIYHFNTTSRALIALSNNDVLEPNGLAFSKDEKTLYIADSNSTSGKPVSVWESSVRNVYAFDVDVRVPKLSNPRLVHVAERGWPDGLRVTKDDLLLVAIKGGIDVVDVSRGGVLLGKINVGDDTIFNLEPIGDEGMWMLTGSKAVYKVRVAR